MSAKRQGIDPGHTASRFRTTQWTLIGRARGDEAALNALLSAYWSPVYAFFRRSGFSRHDADDLTQSFLASQTKRLLDGADEARGNFRAYLKRALKNYAIDEHRRQRGRDGERPQQRLVGDAAVLERIDARYEQNPAAAYDHEFAAVILDEAIRRTKAECEAERRSVYWQAYEMTRLDPHRSGNAVPSLHVVATTLGIERPEDISSMLHTVKRKIQRQLVEVVDETASDARDAATEIAAIRQLLQKP